MRVESFADDLNARRGIVSGRVALLPRSTEIQPAVATIPLFAHDQIFRRLLLESNVFVHRNG